MGGIDMIFMLRGPHFHYLLLGAVVYFITLFWLFVDLYSRIFSAPSRNSADDAMILCKNLTTSLFISVFSEFRPPPMPPPNRGGGSSSSSTSYTTTTRSPPYYTTPRPLLTTSPGQRYRATTTIRQPILVPASGSSSDTSQILDTNQKSGRSPPLQLIPPAPHPPALPPQEFCSPRVMADISWPRTQQGQTAKQPCPVGILGMKTEFFLD